MNCAQHQDPALANLADAARDRFPRASSYDHPWILGSSMGPNPLWLTEWLCQRMDLHPGMRVLDLGCGMGLSSIFLAREFDVQVWAADLWVPPTKISESIRTAGLAEQVFPIHADARKLPFAEGFFDAIVCVDAYIYFGTDDLYLDDLVRFVRGEGQLGIVVPGFMQDIRGKLPEHLRPFWAQECWSWHTIDWWRWLWQRTGLVSIETADSLDDGWRLWASWERAVHATQNPEASQDDPGPDAAVLLADQGRYMGFHRMIARRNRLAETS